MPKKDKAKAAEKKAAKATRQTKKSEKTQKKTKAKSRGDDGSDEDVDLEAVLAEYAKQVRRFHLTIFSHVLRSTLSTGRSLRYVQPHILAYRPSLHFSLYPNACDIVQCK